MKQFILSGLLFCFVQACFSQKNVLTIRELNKSMENAFNSNDMLKVASLYLDSAIISGGRSHITGRTNIDNYWLTLKDKSASWKLEIDAVEDYESIIIQRGKSYLTFSSNSVQRQSNVKFLLVWKKVDSGYKILYDYFSML